MSKAGIYILLGLLKEAYPRFYADKPDDEMEAAAAIWREMLSDTDDETAMIALKRLIATCKFPPTIAEMRESVSAVKYPAFMDASEAWGEVNFAIREYGYNRQDKAFSLMCEPVRLTVQHMGWRELCLSENDMADRAHFIKLYDAVINGIKEERQLPVDLNKNIAALRQKVIKALAGTEK